MRYWIGRGLEVFGMSVALVGLFAGVANHGSSNAIRYEIACLVAGVGIFYAGNFLRSSAEKGGP